MRFYKFLQEAKTKAPSLAKVKATLEKDCAPFIKASAGNFLWRGFNGWNSKEMQETGITKLPIQERKPNGTGEVYFSVFNDWLKSKGHVSRDKAVFAISSRKEAGLFGWPLTIWPIGNFKYTWITGDDFNTRESSTWNSYALIWHLRDKFLNKTDDRYNSNADRANTAGWLIYKVSEKDGKLSLPTEKDLKNPNTSIAIQGCFYMSKAVVKKVSEWNKLEKDLSGMITSNSGLTEAIKNGYEIWLTCDEFYVVDADKLKFKKW